MLKVFIPKADSEAVRKICHKLGTSNSAVTITVVAGLGDKERDCYVNVRNKVVREGGRMRLGWAVWQHGHLFVEAEPHALYEPTDGGACVDVTPHTLPDGTRCREILFIPNENAVPYDFDTTDVSDNVRIALVNDPRVSEALRLFSEKAALMNSVPIIGGPLPTDVNKKIVRLDFRIGALLTAALQPQPAGKGQRIGRNDPCPCGSGKKYKKCCGK